MIALVIEGQPLVRLGIRRMLECMPGMGAVRAIEPAAIVTIEESRDSMLVVYGMSADTADNWYLLRRLHQALPNARILLLSDNMWMRVPSTIEACGVAAHLPKSASVERIEATIFQMLGCEGFMPLAADRLEGWRPMPVQRVAL